MITFIQSPVKIPYVRNDIASFFTSAVPCIPTGLFAILDSRDRKIGEFSVVQERRTTDLEAPKL